jgi:glycosyltransferase involved in cell wall biosynthesis
MKTVLVCAVQAPFVTGGAEILVGELRDNLARRGFRVDVVSVPFHGHPPSELVRQALTWRLLEIREPTGRDVDLVIPTKFPSYLVRHPRKVTWLFHQHREAYDLFGGPYCSLTDSEDDRRVRESIRTMDETSLGEGPPPQQVGRYRTDGHGDFLFYAGRLERLKRLDLAVEALARTKSAARLKIAGAGPLKEELQKQARRLGVEGRIDFLGFVPAQELLALYASCRAAYYTPVDEDYGYVTVEAFLSRKPVLTTTDAGGPLEFVTDGESGLVAPAEPAAVAEAIDRLFALPEARLREMGEAGHARVAHINWDHVIDRLTEAIG